MSEINGLAFARVESLTHKQASELRPDIAIVRAGSEDTSYFYLFAGHAVSKFSDPSKRDGTSVAMRTKSPTSRPRKALDHVHEVSKGYAFASVEG